MRNRLTTDAIISEMDTASTEAGSFDYSARSRCRAKYVKCSNRVSSNQVSVAGKPNFRGRDKEAETIATLPCGQRDQGGAGRGEARCRRRPRLLQQRGDWEEAGITVTMPKPMTSNAKAEGRFGKQDFRYVADEDIYVCPAGEKLAYHYTTEENSLVLRRYWTNVCQSCAKSSPLAPPARNDGSRWEHEHILEAVQRRLDEHPEKMRQRRETVEHPFGTIKARMGATHFLMKTLPRVASEMALHVLAYNLTRVMNIMGIGPLMAAMRA